MADDGVPGGVGDEVEAAVKRLFADAWREAGRALAESPMVDLADDADMVVTHGDVDELDGGAVAVRSASTMVDRQLLVHGDWLDVVLDLVESGDYLAVRGMVVAVDEPYSVQLLDDTGNEVALSVTDQFGEFALPEVVPGRYELVVAGRRAELSAVVDIS
jgi:hypothetical protein